MTTDPHLDDLLDIVIDVVVADALPNEKRPRDPAKEIRAGVEDFDVRNNTAILPARKLSARPVLSELARARECRRLRDRAELERAWRAIVRGAP